MKRVAILLTCHNRREKTKRCLDTLLTELGPEIRADVIAADSDSDDGTPDMLKEYKNPAGKIILIHVSGKLFWNGGMRVAMSHAAKRRKLYDYVLLVNDDVEFYPGALEALIKRLEDIKADAVAGSTVWHDGRQSYGGVKKSSKYLARFELIPPSEEPVLCDTFNCNCLLVTMECFIAMGNLDRRYVHSMGDYDYGLRMKAKGRIVVNAAANSGVCDDNAVDGSWRDTGLTRTERLKKKESPGGLPAADWFHFVHKNYSLPAALYHSVTPYVRILLGK